MSVESLKAYNNLYEINERKEVIAEILRILRTQKGYSQKEVCNLIGVNTSTYSAYEVGRNEPPAEILIRLSILYDIPLEIIMQKDNYSKDPERALVVLNNYDKQLEEMKSSLENNPTLSALFDAVQELNDKLTDKVLEITEE